MSEVKEQNPNVETGNISVHTENIFPIIKKSLYSDHEIFLRELVSNSVDAIQKVKHLTSIGKYDKELGDLKVTVSLDEEAGTLTISDNGIGMTAEEVKKYINQVAFSGAEEFVKQFESVKDAKEIIGQFGLGFYSAFMVSESVEIVTKSWQDEPAAHWTCDGSTSYTLAPHDRQDRGTDIILHIAEDSKEFLEKARVSTILGKYCRFLPVEVEFDGEVINTTNPIWNKTPTELTDEDYLAFYKDLYPFQEDPLFWIHLNVDFPFELTGILYFPKLKNNLEVRKDRIHLYSRQVFITDSVEQIVPEYLTLLQGVIDSPDIPLNVSRSFLQADSNVKKISNYITKKVADKLKEIYNEDKEAYEAKWPDISVFVKYGMLTDDKFAERATDFCLLTNIASEMFLIEEYKEKTKALQTDKDDNLVWLYTTDKKTQDAYIQSALRKNYDILEMDTVIDSHFIAHLEQKVEKLSIKRVDADSVDKLIPKDEELKSTLTEEQETELVDVFKAVVAEKNEPMDVQAEPLGADEMPVVLVRPEFMRRMKDMSAMGGAMGMGNLPDSINVVVNTSHEMAQKILDKKKSDTRQRYARQVMDLALLSQNMLSGPEMTQFLQRSVEMILKK